MRILHTIDSFDPRWGYAEFYLAKNQKASGSDVCVVSSVFPPYGDQRWSPGLDRPEGIQVFYVRSACKLRGNVLFFDPFSLQKIISDFSPDIVHCHGLLSPLSQMVLVLKGSSSYRVVGDIITGISPFALQLLPAFKRFLNFSILHGVDKLFACNRAIEKFLTDELGISASKVHFIPLGANIEPSEQRNTQREEIRKELGISLKDIVAIYTGKFLPEKRILDLLKASRPVINDYPNFKLILVGDGPQSYKERMDYFLDQYGIKKNVFIVETVHRKRLPSFYNAADLAVWPGTFSISIIEAMACGLPIIIAKSDWTSHYLTYNNGYSFIAGEVRSLASLLMNLVRNNGLRDDMGKRSRELVEAELNWTKITRQYQEVYELVLKQGKRDDTMCTQEFIQGHDLES